MAAAAAVSGAAERLEHGGRLRVARAAFPDAPAPFLDLSTGINPVPYPVPALPPHTFARLPEPEDTARLEAVAARAYGVADPACVVAAPGTQVLIGLLPHLLPHRAVAVLGPTYGEHAASWAAAGAAVREVPALDALAGAGAAVLCNPNNPDGRRHDPAALRDLARRVGLLVVDEAFADLEPDVPGLAPGGLPGNAVVLRSFGKTFGLAGLRLGFALAVPAVAARLRNALGPWAVSGPALAIGCQALADTGWRDAAAARCAADAARLDRLLGAAGLRLAGGTRLFRLAEDGDAARRHRRLGEAGILVRRFARQPSWLRVGLPGEAAAWQRLENALQR